MTAGGDRREDNIAFREMATEARQAKWRRTFSAQRFVFSDGRVRVYTGLAMDEKHPVERKFGVSSERRGQGNNLQQAKGQNSVSRGRTVREGRAVATCPCGVAQVGGVGVGARVWGVGVRARVVWRRWQGLELLFRQPWFS